MASINMIRRFGDVSLPAGQTILGGQLVVAAVGPVTRTVADGATTNASATVTSATAAFQQADVGDSIAGAGIPTGATILTVNSATSVTISANATATATGVSLTITVPTNPDSASGTDVAYVAGASATNVLGVAQIDAEPYSSINFSGANPPVAALAVPLADRVTVVNHCEVPVTYASAATVGQKLLAAANGAVTPAGAGPASDQVVGYCLKSTASGAVGPAYIGGI